MLKIDSELAKRVYFTSEYFEHGTIWDCRPKIMYVTSLFPKKGEESYRLFLSALDKATIPIELTAPDELLKTVALEFGYEYFVDPAGTPYMNNKATKVLKKLKNK